MEIKVFIVSLACLSCLVPSTVAASLTAKAVALGAAKGVLVKKAAVGVGLGLAAKGLIAKKALLGILLKAALLKGVLVAKKVKGVGALALQGLGGTTLAEAAASSAADSSEADFKTTTLRSPFRDLLSGTARVMQSTIRLGEAAAQKSRALYRIVSMVPRMIDPTVTD